MKKLNLAIIGQGRSGRDIHGKFYRSEANTFFNVKYVVDMDAPTICALTGIGITLFNIGLVFHSLYSFFKLFTKVDISSSPLGSTEPLLDGEMIVQGKI